MVPSLLNLTKGKDPYSLRAIVIKTITVLVAQPLTDVFNLSLTSAEVTADWRSAMVCPSCKKSEGKDQGIQDGLGIQEGQF